MSNITLTSFEEALRILILIAIEDEEPSFHCLGEKDDSSRIPGLPDTHLPDSTGKRFLRCFASTLQGKDFKLRTIGDLQKIKVHAGGNAIYFHIPEQKFGLRAARAHDKNHELETREINDPIQIKYQNKFFENNIILDQVPHKEMMSSLDLSPKETEMILRIWQGYFFSKGILFSDQNLRNITTSWELADLGSLRLIQTEYRKSGWSGSRSTDIFFQYWAEKDPIQGVRFLKKCLEETEKTYQKTLNKRTFDQAENSYKTWIYSSLRKSLEKTPSGKDLSRRIGNRMYNQALRLNQLNKITSDYNLNHLYYTHYIPVITSTFDLQH